MLRRILNNVVSQNSSMFYNTSSILSNSTITNTVADCQSISDFYAGKSVFITGGTGFLGKVLIERLLFNCADIETIYVLVREKRGVKAEERVKGIVNDVLFSKLKEVRPKDIKKIVPIIGDISSFKLGLKPEDENTLVEKVSVVFHSAADVGFIKPVKYMVKHNVGGTLQLLNLSRQIKNMQAYVHISTAYSNEDKGPVIDEIVYPPPCKLNEVYDLIENGEVETKKVLNGKLNTYTFSKALAETVVAEEHGNIPAIIIRPSIVSCVKHAPLPGWIDNWNGYTGLICYTSNGLVRVIQGKKTTLLNYIPVDYTINLTIAAAANCGTSGEVKVYNSCTSIDKPLSLGTLIDKFGEEYRKTIPGNRKQSKIYFTMSTGISSILTMVIHRVPAYVSDLWLYCRGKEPRYVKEMKKALTTRNVLRFFSTNTFEWKMGNVLDLYRSLSPADRERFPFHPSDITWDEYIKVYCKGVYEHLLAKKNRKD